MKNEVQIHHRRSIRLKWYDYTQPGAYFVTICTYQRDEIFGTVVNNEMQLLPLGEIVRIEWFRSAEIRKEIHLFEDEFVVMPNHIHGIVWMVENNNVGADGVHPMIDDIRPLDDGDRPEIDGVCPVEDNIHPVENMDITNPGACHAPLRRKPRSLSSFIAGFKASVTGRGGRELNVANIWQRNYYEHIIRNQTELRNFWDYIDINPLRWQEDQLHPSAPPNQFNQDNP